MSGGSTPSGAAPRIMKLATFMFWHKKKAEMPDQTGSFETRRSVLKKLALAGLMLPGGSALLAACVKARPFVAGFQSLRGEVRINGQKARGGLWQGPGSVVENGADAHATLVVGENAFMLRPNSRVVFQGGPAAMLPAPYGARRPADPALSGMTAGKSASQALAGARRMVAQGGAEAEKVHDVRPVAVPSVSSVAAGAGGASTLEGLLLAKGGLLSVVQTGLQPVIRTPAAIFGIRGTGLYLEADEEHTYVCTCYGTVDIRSSQDPQLHERVNTRHHEAPRDVYRSRNGAPRIAPGKLRAHTDAELILLESLVGRRPPFYGHEDEMDLY